MATACRVLGVVFSVANTAWTAGEEWRVKSPSSVRPADTMA